MTLWKVYKGKQWIGIVESNYAFASKYWARVAQRTGKPFHLVGEP